MRDSPLKLAVLRQAFIRQNPAAFEAGKTPRLRKGAVLIVPDHAALLLSLMPPSLAAAAPMAVAAPMAASVAAPVDVESASPLTQAAGDDRRQWVRYP
jgi:Tfp pilus assembly protein FimV